MKQKKSLILTILILFCPMHVYATGYGDWRGLQMDAVLGSVGILAAIVFLIILIFGSEYRIRNLPAILLWISLLLFSSSLAIALNHLLFDRIYFGEHYKVVAACIAFLYPVLLIPFQKSFQKNKTRSSIWKTTVGVTVSIILLYGIWILAETIL